MASDGWCAAFSVVVEIPSMRPTSKLSRLLDLVFGVCELETNEGALVLVYNGGVTYMPTDDRINGLVMHGSIRSCNPCVHTSHSSNDKI